MGFLWSLFLIEHVYLSGICARLLKRHTHTYSVQNRTGKKRCENRIFLYLSIYLSVYMGVYFIATHALHLQPVYIMDDEVGPWKVDFIHWPWSWAMEDGHFPWSDLMVWIFVKSNFKTFGPLTGCTPNVDQEEWPCTKKWMCRFFKYICSKREVLNKIKYLLSCLLLSKFYVSPQKAL